MVYVIWGAIVLAVVGILSLILELLIPFAPLWIASIVLPMVIVAVARRIAVGAIMIFAVGLAVAIVAVRTGNASIGMVLLWTSIVLSVIFFFYEIYLSLENWWAKRCRKDYGGLCENLERDDEQVYDTSHDNLVGVVARIRNKMKIYVKDPGCADLNDHFHHYQELSGVLIGLDQKIEVAYQNLDQREELYRALLEDADFKDSLKYFDELTSSICAIRASIAKKGAAPRIVRVGWYIGLSLTVGALVLLALSFLNALGT